MYDKVSEPLALAAKAVAVLIVFAELSSKYSLNFLA